MIGRLLGRKIYYYIPTCPDCGSRRTGKYVKEPSSAETAQYIMRQSLRHGELITFLPEVPFTNCYCEECGYEWHYDVVGKWISPRRIEEEKVARNTNQKYIAFNRKYPRKKKSLFRKIFSFLPW